MTITTIHEQLEEIGRHIDQLQARARAGAAQLKPRIQRHVDVLRQQEASTRSAIRAAPELVEDRLARLKARLEVAEHSLAADVSQDRAAFTAHVEAELHGWDAYFEHLGASMAMRSGKTREQAKAALEELHQRRAQAGDRLAQLRAASAEAWHQHRSRVAAARDELQESADEVTRQFFGGGDWS